MTLMNAVGRTLSPSERAVLAHLNGANDASAAAALTSDAADAAYLRREARRHRALAGSYARVA